MSVKPLSTEDDKQWVELALSGSEMGYRKLSQKYQMPLTHHIGRMVRDEDDVADLVQETFVKAFQSLASYSAQFAFSTWLYKIATNHTIDFIRKKKLKTISIHQPIETKDGAVEFEVPDEQYRPDRHIVEDERAEILKKAISGLPEKYHKVIMMRHVSEKSYEEIADELGLPLGTVKAHIFRAREMLYKALKDQRNDF